MAISREDKADVKGALGKAMANKVAKVTNDRKHTFAGTGKKKWTDREASGISELIKDRAKRDIASGNYVKLKYSSDKHQSSLHGTPISARGDKSGTTHKFTAKRPSDISKHPLHTQRDIMKRDPKGDYKHGLK